MSGLPSDPNTFISTLTGPNNQPWAHGRRLLAEGKPAELVKDLEEWRKATAELSRWTSLAKNDVAAQGRFRAQAYASTYVLQAAAEHAQKHERERQAFLKKAGGLLKKALPGLSPDAIKAALRAAEARAFDPGLADSPDLPPIEAEQHAFLLAAGLRRKAFRLLLQRSPSPTGKWVATPELVDLGVTSFDKTFLETVNAALDHAVEKTKVRDAGPCWFRWSILDAKEVSTFDDRSAGGLFATLFLGMIEEKEIDPFVGMTAALGAEGKLEHVDHQGIKEKVKDGIERGIHTFVLSREDHAALGGPLAKEHPGVNFAPAETPRDALEDYFTKDFGAVVGFLERFAKGERALLEPRVRYLPGNVRRTGKIFDFLVPPRVVAGEWAIPGRAMAGRAPSPGGPDDDDGDETAPPGTVDLDSLLGDFHLATSPPRHVLIEGDPGYGKSTLLWRQFTRHARKLLSALRRGKVSCKGPGCLAPLALSLRKLRGKATSLGAAELLRLAREEVLDIAYGGEDPADDGTMTEKKLATAWLEKKSRCTSGPGQFVLYLDGYDELDPRPVSDEAAHDAGGLRAALQELRQGKVLLTSRSGQLQGTGPLIEPLRLKAAAFDWEDVKLYVERSFPRREAAKAKAFLAGIGRTPGPRGLVTVPLFLALTREYAQADDLVELTRGAPRTRLLRTALHAFLKRAREALRLEAKKSGRTNWTRLDPELIDLLAEAVWERFSQGKKGHSLRSIAAKLKEKASRELRKALGDDFEIAEAYVKAGLLVRKADDDAVDIVLESILEYLVGRYIAGHSRELPRDRLDDPDWRTVWPYVAGEWTLAKQEEAVELQNGLLASLEMAAEMVRWNDDQHIRHVSLLTRVCAECREEARETLEQRVVEALEQRVVKVLGDSRQDGLLSLVENGGRHAVAALLRLLLIKPEWEYWKDYGLRLDVVAALSETCDDGVREALRSVLDAAYVHYDVRERCAAALGPLGLQRELDAKAPPHLARTLAVLRRPRRRTTESFDIDRLNQGTREQMQGRNGFRLLRSAPPAGEKWLAEYEHEQTGVVFMLLPAGEFEMGSPPEEEGREDDEHQHAVRVSPFLLARYALADSVYAQWTGPSPEGRPIQDAAQAESLPADKVSWDHAVQFCERFGWVLPTEAQWEYACRAGTSGRFSFGDVPDHELTANMNFEGSKRGRVCSVGDTRYKPNAFGLWQMLRNVWEWCHDVYALGFYYREEAKGPDPLCLAGSWFRVLRGGSARFDAGGCRAAYRCAGVAGTFSPGAGFRPSLSLLPPARSWLTSGSLALLRSESSRGAHRAAVNRAAGGAGEQVG